MAASGPALTREQEHPGARVLVLTNMWPDEEKPAYGIFIRRQVGSLREAGIECDVLYLRGYRSSLAYLWAAVTMLRLSLRRRRPYDLVHAHGGEAGLAARFHLRAPVMVSYCGGDLLGTIGPDGELTRGSRLRRPVLRALARFMSATITKSRQMEACLPGRARDRNTVLPNGVDRSVFAPMPRDEARRRLGWPLDERVALFAADPKSGGSRTARESGRSDKRFWLAEAACERAKERIPDLRLRAAAGVPPADMPLLMNAADCLILTSATEGSPNVVKEAVMCDLPVVTTEVGDVSDVLADVEPSYICEATEEELAGALVDCLAEPRRSNGRERSAWLDQGAIAARLAELYDTLAPGIRAR